MMRDPLDVAREAHEAKLDDYAEGVMGGSDDGKVKSVPPWVDDYDRTQRITDEEHAE